MSDLSTAAPTVHQMLWARCEELAQEHDRALEAKIVAESHYDEFVKSARRLNPRSQEFTTQASQRASEFQAAAWQVGMYAPICRVAAAELTLPCGLSLAEAGQLADRWASGRKTSPLNDEKKLENALSYFGWRSPIERALGYAHEHRIMDRTDLHPSWTREILESLNKDSSVHILDDEAVREASRLVGRE